MNDSDFTIGFKQGQEHGKQIMLEKIEDIKQEIVQDIENGIIQISKGNERLFSIIDKHIGD